MNNEKFKEVNFNEFYKKKLKPFKEQMVVRILPDTARLICYSQFEFNGEDYLYFPDKVVYIKLERFSKHLLVGRNKLFAIMANLKYLNPELDEQKLSFWCGYIIENHFDEEFEKETISEVVNWVMKKYDNNELRPNGKYRRVIFNPAKSILTGEKLRISGQLTSKVSAVSEQMLYDCIEPMQCRDKPFSLNDIAVEIKTSLATVKRNMTKPLISFMKEINCIIRDNRDLDKLENATTYYKNTGVKYKISELRKKCGFSGKRLKYLLNLKKGQN